MHWQVCAEARSEEDKGTGAILKCLVSKVDSLSSSCARETGRAARYALQFYQPKAPITDICDSDIAALCLGSQGLDQFGIGQVRPPVIISLSACFCISQLIWWLPEYVGVCLSETFT